MWKVWHLVLLGDGAVGVAVGVAADLLDRDLSLLALILVIGTVVLKLVTAHEAQSNAGDAPEPEQVEGLEGHEEGSGDDLAETALVLLGLPVDFEGTDSLKLGKERPDYLEVDVVTEVDPHGHEESEVRGDERVIDVVKSLGGGEEEVADVVGNVDSQADVGEVEAVAEADEGETDDVVGDELLEILTGLLHSEDEDNGLLSPVCGLEEVVELDTGLLSAMGEILVHASGVEVPDRSAAHDVHAKGTEDTKIDGRVQLLHETCLLALTETVPSRQGSEQLLHDELASKGEDDGIEGDEGEVPFALSIVGGSRGIIVGELVGEEDESMEGVRGGGIDGVTGSEDGEDDEREDKGVLDAELAESGEGTSCATTFREAFGTTVKLLRMGVEC